MLLAVCGCSGNAKLSSQAPSPADIQVTPWRVIDRAPPGTPGGTLRVSAFGSGPKTFNPITANETNSTDIIQQTFSGLLDVNYKTGKVVNGLAYKYTHSKDGKVWIFHLRKGLKWSDGYPLTADDVVFTFRVIYDPNVENPSRDVAQVNGKPIRCEKVNGTTVRFILPGTYGPFPFLMGSIQIIPKHALQASFSNGTFSSAYGVNTPPDKIVCSGPFRIKEYVPQQRIILERNPYFYAKDVKGQRLPYLDRIVVVYVPDSNTEFLKFLSGETDAFVGFPPKFYDDMAAGEKTGNYHVMDLGPNAATQFIVFNENPSSKYLSPVKLRWFSDVRFRKALAYAVNRQTMIRLAYLGRGYPCVEDFHPGSPYYDEKIKAIPYDPDLSKALLSQAGFFWKSGILFDKDGNRVGFTLLTNSGNAARSILGESFKEELGKIGIEVDFHPVDFNELISRLDHEFNFDAVLIGLVDEGGSIEPSNDQNVWLSTGFTHEWNPREKKPATPWEAEIDRLVAEGTGTLEFKKRKEDYDRIQEILYNQEFPMIMLTVGASLYAFRNTVGNALPTSIGRFWESCPDDMLMSQVYMKPAGAP